MTTSGSTPQCGRRESITTLTHRARECTSYGTLRCRTVFPSQPSHRGGFLLRPVEMRCVFVCFCAQPLHQRLKSLPASVKFAHLTEQSSQIVTALRCVLLQSKHHLRSQTCGSPQRARAFLQTWHFLGATLSFTAPLRFCAQEPHQRRRFSAGIPKFGLQREQSSHILEDTSTAPTRALAQPEHQRRVRSSGMPKLARLALHSSHILRRPRYLEPGCFFAQPAHQHQRRPAVWALASPGGP